MTATLRKLVAVRDTPQRERARDLRDAVRDAVEAMTWLSPSDEALKTLALRLADEIEQAADRAEELAHLMRDMAGDRDAYRRLQKLEAQCDAAKAVGWLGQQLQGVLRDLGGAPATRKAFQTTDAPVGGRLAQLRADAANRAG